MIKYKQLYNSTFYIIKKETTNVMVSHTGTIYSLYMYLLLDSSGCQLFVFSLDLFSGINLEVLLTLKLKWIDLLSNFEARTL